MEKENKLFNWRFPEEHWHKSKLSQEEYAKNHKEFVEKYPEIDDLISESFGLIYGAEIKVILINNYKRQNNDNK